ncbi:MAG: hypothetical protein HY710_01665 [Candidatus Latescibacteria bacterium]|nr:hypothetical protein [Candidatus Latescibacterota bacterium]
MPYYSSFFGIEVRDEIAEEFREPDGSVDDMMAGLHEIRARLAEQKYDLAELERRQHEKGTLDHHDFEECQRSAM